MTVKQNRAVAKMNWGRAKERNPHGYEQAFPYDELKREAKRRRRENSRDRRHRRRGPVGHTRAIELEKAMAMGPWLGEFVDPRSEEVVDLRFGKIVAIRRKPVSGWPRG